MLRFCLFKLGLLIFIDPLCPRESINPHRINPHGHKALQAAEKKTLFLNLVVTCLFKECLALHKFFTDIQEISCGLRQSIFVTKPRDAINSCSGCHFSDSLSSFLCATQKCFKFRLSPSPAGSVLIASCSTSIFELKSIHQQCVS